MTNQYKLEYIIKTLTNKELCIQTIEECAELQQALTKYLRSVDGMVKPNSEKEIYDNLDEEIADVFLCLKVLADYGFYAMDEVEQIADYKLDRWVNRLNGDWTE